MSILEQLGLDVNTVKAAMAQVSIEQAPEKPMSPQLKYFYANKKKILSQQKKYYKKNKKAICKRNAAYASRKWYANKHQKTSP